MDTGSGTGCSASAALGPSRSVIVPASPSTWILWPDRMRLVAEKIPQVEFTVWPDVGHAGIAKYCRDVLREL